MATLSENYAFYVVPLANITDEILDAAIQDGAAALRIDAAGTNCLLKFERNNVPAAMASGGRTCITYAAARTLLLGANWGLE